MQVSEPAVSYTYPITHGLHQTSDKVFLIMLWNIKKCLPS